ncbi:hypothetical protein GQ44DRAFT_753689 [Phaeosphaeriaceae sp. PMI808]|nr:hypothetical protein GQ44DRAFT_753689 [Phaeosphaeriaceae sp. PMI808]
MADTDVAAATVANPASAQATESSHAKADDKTTTSSDGTKTDVKSNGDSEPKSKLEDAAEKKSDANGASKNGASDDKTDGHDRNGREDRFRDRRDGRDGRGGRGGRGGGRGRGRGGFNNNKRREKDDFDNLPESSDPVEIRNQVEFYFSTHNLSTDEHMFLELGGPKNLPVSIKHITDFKRMRHFRPYSAVVSALRESKDLIVVDDGEFSGIGNEAVKRSEALIIPLEDADKDKDLSVNDLFYRLKKSSSNKIDACIYAKDFGDLAEAGQIVIEQFFRPYGSIMIRKRRDDKGAWKGSVFVEFDSEDSQKQFLALDPKPKFNGNELFVMSKRDYIIMKCEEKGIEPDFEGKKQFRGNRAIDRHRGGERGGRRGDRDGGNGYQKRPRTRRDRDRRNSNGSGDDRNWNKRRDDFRQGKDDKGSRKEIECDGYGIPVVQDTRTEAEIAAAASKKRKADDEERADVPKKSKLEIKEDE